MIAAMLVLTLSAGTAMPARAATSLLGPSVADPNLNQGGIKAIAVQGDGNILPGGGFSTVNSGARPQAGVVRLNPDGSIGDRFANPAIPNAVYAPAVQGDGRILVAGEFHTVGATTSPSLARFRADGSVDGSTAFPNPNLDNASHALALHGDVSFIVGGTFTTAGKGSELGACGTGTWRGDQPPGGAPFGAAAATVASGMAAGQVRLTFSTVRTMPASTLPTGRSAVLTRFRF